MDTRGGPVVRLINSKPYVTDWLPTTQSEPSTRKSSGAVGGSMKHATENWDTWPPICSCCSPAGGAARSSVGSASPRSKRRDAAEAYGANGATGGTIQRCAPRSGACCAINATRLRIRLRAETPDGTSHTCPHCGEPARTYRSPRPEHRSDPVKWGRWLCCAHCGFNGDRDYCAALNIGRLGIAFVTSMQLTGTGKGFAVTEIVSVKPCAI
jgi:Putative transposase DNA-binding domain